LRIGEEFGLQGRVLVRGGAARFGAGERADGNLAVTYPDEDFGTRTGNGKRAEVEEVQERRRIDPAQRTIERERRQRERRLKTLRQHHLENVASENIVL